MYGRYGGSWITLARREFFARGLTKRSRRRRETIWRRLKGKLVCYRRAGRHGRAQAAGRHDNVAAFLVIAGTRSGFKRRVKTVYATDGTSRMKPADFENAGAQGGPLRLDWWANCATDSGTGESEARGGAGFADGSTTHTIRSTVTCPNGCAGSGA